MQGLPRGSEEGWMGGWVNRLPSSLEERYSGVVAPVLWPEQLLHPVEAILSGSRTWTTYQTDTNGSGRRHGINDAVCPCL